MKRIMMLVLAIMLVLAAVPSLAEEIVLPNGLEFGMSISEAAAVSGFSVSKEDANKRGGAYLEALDFDHSYLLGRVIIGGHEATAKVYFHNDALKQIAYCFVAVSRDGSDTGYDPEVEESWKSVGTALTKKYGNPAELSHEFDSTGVDFSFGSGSNKRKETHYGRTESYLVLLDNGGSVYLDNCMLSRMNMADTGSLSDLLNAYYYQDHYLFYTYYDFQVNEEQTTNNVIDF